MVHTVEATFDGEVIRPDEPLAIRANTRVRLIHETLPSEAEQPRSFLRTARSLDLEGPSDWSPKFDEYFR